MLNSSDLTIGTIGTIMFALLVFCLFVWLIRGTLRINEIVKSQVEQNKLLLKILNHLKGIEEEKEEE